MKIIIAFFFAAFFAGSALAQDTTQQQIPPSVQTDTTSGWQLMFSNPNYTIDMLQYFPENTVYAQAYNGSIKFLLRSFDRGITWDTLSIPIPSGVTYFTSPSTGYSADDPSKMHVWKTTNGGQNWTPHDRMSAAYGPIAFANNDTGLVFGICCTARTTDAGITWGELPFSYNVIKYDASFTGSKIGYAVGDAGSFQGNLNVGFFEKTTDGGATWKEIYTKIRPSLYSCAVLDSNFVIIGSNNKIGRTIDGGNTWDTMTVLGFFQEISFANKSHGLIAGADSADSNNPHGVIYSTIDSGKTWQKQFLPNAPLYTGLVMLDDSIALVCGGGNIYRTSSSGNFMSVSKHSNDLQVQIFPNPAAGIINIQCQLPSAEQVDINFFNIQGIKVGTINSGIQNAGIHQAIFDGSSLPNGIYYVRVRCGSEEVNREIEFIK